MAQITKKVWTAFSFLTFLAVVCSPSAHAGDWTMDFTVSIPDSNSDGGMLVNRLEAGSLSTGTDLFDNDLDAMALLAGPVQAAFSHEGETTYPGYLQLLWRDVRAAGLPKSWTIKVVSEQNSSPVTLGWTAPPAIPSDSCHLGRVGFLDQTTGQWIDLNAASSYSYVSNGTVSSSDIRFFTLMVNSIPQNAPSIPTGLRNRSTGSHQPHPDSSSGEQQRDSDAGYREGHDQRETDDGPSMIQLQWTPNDRTSLTGYHVWRSTSSGSGYVRLTSAPTLRSRYADKQVTARTTYYYVVTAVGTNGCESGFSQEIVASATQ